MQLNSIKMKKSMTRLTVFSLFIIALLLSAASCPKDDPCVQETCTPSSSEITKSINVFDYTLTSTYYNQVVANFKFVQTKTYYPVRPNECTTCPTDGYSVTLQISNATNKTIHFDYSISFLLNFASWNYQGVATINPNGSINVGQISNNGSSISLGQILIQSANITYQ